MKLKIEINNKEFFFDSSDPLQISIPVIFNGEQPNTYNVDKASAKAYETGDFIGDTRRGGGCNFEEYKIVPHCNGTHTECVGHISLERISVNNILKDSFIPATLITVSPEKSSKTNDNYIPEKNIDDFIITKKVLNEKLKSSDAGFTDALIIRTLPNNDSKKSMDYMKKYPPFFSIEAMEFIVSLNVKHLLIDIPSVDRTFDEGKLTAHHIFWNVPFESHEVSLSEHSMKTITEMVYVPDEIADGKFILNIQIPDFIADAAPSRVLIYRVV
ncbi:MAG TPA: cyclase family protein [Ignavibacteria bacterium]|nr:cyclase family protein [Ignavibacteria bacterium]